MHSLIIDCTGFLLKFAVYAINGDGDVYERSYMTTEEVAGYAVANPDIKSIKITGPTDYCFSLKDDIRSRLALGYSVNDIEIEVIK